MRKPSGTMTQVVRAGDLIFDEDFNRQLDRSWGTRLMADLDPRAIGALVISERPDGSKVVVDGQHRAWAVLRKWGANATVVCVVHRGLTKAEEADLFYRLNLRRGLRAYDRFRAEVVARHPHALEIVATLEEFGLTFGQCPSAKTVGAVVALENAHRHETLAPTLSLLSTAWGYSASTWDGYLIDGAALFLRRYPNADRDALRHKLAAFRGGAEGFLGKAKAWKTLHSLSTARAVAALLVDTYNVRRRTGQLPPWS